MPEAEDMDTSDDSNSLYRLAEELRRLRADGLTVNVTELAERFQVSGNEVRRCLAGLDAIEAALGEETREAGGTVETPAGRPPELPEDFEVLEEIGRGGMGIVYRVRQRSLDRVVAVKVLRPGELVFGEALRRFSKEARALGRLKHPHIVSIHEVGEAGGNLYFSMDYAEGCSLAELIRRGAITPSRAVKLLRQVCSAIAYTHSHGLIHRDLKPGNILLDADGEAYVADFGLARDSAARGDLTGTGDLLGTPAYMSPEQARGEADRIGEATDIYALGAILYECLTGRSPFGGMPVAEMVHAVVHRDPPAPRRLNPRIPLDLEVICQKALEKRPERRYATVQALLEELERFESGRPIRARKPSLWYRFRRFLSRNRSAVAAALGSASLLVLIYTFLILPWIGDTREAILQSAEKLHSRGNHEAAASLYEDLIRREGWDSSAAEGFAEQVHGLLFRCRLEAARTFLEEERLEEGRALLQSAREQLDRNFQEAGGERELQWLWERARLQDYEGNREGALLTYSRIRESLQGRKDEEVLEPGSLSRLGRCEAPLEMLERMKPALFDPEAPGYETAVAFLHQFVSDRWSQRDAFQWLARQGEQVFAVIPALVTEMTRKEDWTEQLLLWDGLYRLALEVKSRRLEKTLAEGLADEELEPVVRTAFSVLLASLADLPVCLFGRPYEGNLYPQPLLEQRALESWKSTHDLSSVASYRAKVAFAVTTLREQVEMYHEVEAWLRMHTGRSFEEVGEKACSAWREWWSKHGAEDPRAWLTRALQLSEIPGPGEVFSILKQMLRAQGERRVLLHQLLSLIVPETVSPPAGIEVDSEPSGFAMAWWNALSQYVPEQEYQLRVAQVALRNGSPHPVLLWEELRPVRIGESVEFRHESPIPGEGAYGFQLPGFSVHVPQEQVGTEWIQAQASIVWRRSGLVLSFDQVWEQTSSGGYSTSGGGTGEEALAGMVMVAKQPNEWLRDMDSEIGTRFLLALLEPPGSDASSWTIPDWLDRLAENIHFLADEACREALQVENQSIKRMSSFLDSYYQTMSNQASLACFLAVPQAAADLARIHALNEAGLYFDTNEHFYSRILAGDLSVLDRESGHISFGAEMTPAYWARVLLTAEHPQFREMALEELKAKLPRHVAITIEQAIQEGRLKTPPDWLRTEVEGRQEQYDREVARAKLPYQLGAAIVFVLAGCSTFLALLPFKTLAWRLLPAAGMVLMGMLVCCIHIDLERSDYLPDAVGYGLAAAGALLLALAARGRLSWVPVSGFLLAAPLDLLGRRMGEPHVLLWFSCIPLAIAVVFIPVLSRALRKGAKADPSARPRRYPITFLVLYCLPVTLWIMTAITSSVLDKQFTFTIDRGLANLILTVMAIAVLGVLFGLLRAAADRARRMREELRSRSARAAAD